MRFFLAGFMMFIASETQSIEVHSEDKDIPPDTNISEITLKTVTVHSKWSKYPDIDTLANYIATQSKNDTIDINSMVQVMINRFNKSDFASFSDMLYSKGTMGSTTVREHKSRYWFSQRGKKYLPKIYNEIDKVLDGDIYTDMKDVFYFSNHKCNYHKRQGDKYELVFSSNKHRYYKKK